MASSLAQTSPERIAVDFQVRVRRAAERRFARVAVEQVAETLQVEVGDHRGSRSCRKANASATTPTALAVGRDDARCVSELRQRPFLAVAAAGGAPCAISGSLKAVQNGYRALRAPRAPVFPPRPRHLTARRPEAPSLAGHS